MESRSFTSSECDIFATDSHPTPHKKAAPLHSQASPCPESGIPQIKRSLIIESCSSDEDHKCVKRTRYEPYYHRWTCEDGSESGLMLSPSVMSKLKMSFTLSRDAFEPFIALYAKYKYTSAMKGIHPYSVPKGFYSLFRDIGSVTHEMFSDAINFSSEVPHFCSINKDDTRFGSSGPWEDNEGVVEGAAGHPPFETKFLLNLLSRIHEEMKTGRPYFRALVLPYQEGTEVYNLIVDDLLGGEVLAIIRPELQAKWFIHQLNFFRYEHREYVAEQRFAYPVCVAVWMNEAYQRKYPPPLDVEECFMVWEQNDFGPEAGVVDYNMVGYSFPTRNRGCHVMVGDFKDCSGSCCS